jgi:hypothetical protein
VRHFMGSPYLLATVVALLSREPHKLAPWCASRNI